MCKNILHLLDLLFWRSKGSQILIVCKSTKKLILNEIKFVYINQSKNSRLHIIDHQFTKQNLQLNGRSLKQIEKKETITKTSKFDKICEKHRGWVLELVVPFKANTKCSSILEPKTKTHYNHSPRSLSYQDSSLILIQINERKPSQIFKT